MSKWRLVKVFYNGQYFDSAEELAEGYANGTVNKIQVRCSCTRVYNKLVKAAKRHVVCRIDGP